MHVKDSDSVNFVIYKISFFWLSKERVDYFNSHLHPPTHLNYGDAR